jgi:plasmid stabilization system protein ParE
VSEPLRVVVSPLANKQIAKEDAWWRINRTKAPNAIREELERIAALIAFQPNIGPIARNMSLPGVRKIHVERIHCHVYYRVVGSPPYIEIVGFWGARRGTQPPI